MIWIDYVIIGLVFIAFITGFLRGFSLEFFSLVFWLLAIGVGLSFSREFSVFLESIISNPLPKIAASFLLLFLITLIVGSLIRVLLGESIKKTTLTFTDRLGGMIFGALHGMVVVVVLVMLAGLTALPDDLWWKESKLLPSFQICVIWSRDHIPSGLAEYIHYR
ncbi:MAG: CvpA family protein [Methylococcaceae bacterium]|nr:CvpA family protein [Methylococcaceae bacterium]